MKAQDDIDFSTLNWVKQELDETLKQARQALEAYVEDPADTSLMRFCATYLHQVQGTLRMVELYGAAMVVEEMERVALALLDGHIRQTDETYGVLMRGIVQLPDYLERLQSGHKDIPIVLLPLLNDLRASRGEKLLTESVLFSPNLSTPLPTDLPAPAKALPDLELRAAVERLRTQFQVGLVKWFRAENPDEFLGKLVEVLDRMLATSAQEDARRLWWIAASVLDGLRARGIEPNPAIKMLVGRVEREIKRYADVGDNGYKVSPPRDLTKNLLYYAAHANAGGPRIEAVRRTFELERLLPSARELAHAKGSISGHNRALLDTVAAAIKEDLMRVKDALDLFLRTQNANPGDLLGQVEVLDRVRDTLGMLGLGVPRRVVTEQREIIEEIANKRRAADEAALLDIAGALLFVDASLDDHIERLGAGADEDKGEGMALPQTEVRRVLEALIKEASANFMQAKQEIVAFVESSWDHSKIEHIPRLLEEVGGALRILSLPEPAELISGVARFVDIELIRRKRVPSPDQMDKLADAMASIEYYLDATREQRGGRDRILEVTRRSLEGLGYWPVPPELTEEVDTSAAAEPVDSPKRAENVEAVSEASPPLTMEMAPMVADADSASVREAAGHIASVTEPAATTQERGVAPPAARVESVDLTHIAPEMVEGDFPSFTTEIATGESAVRPETSAADEAQAAADSSGMLSVDLPADESLDDFINRLGLEPEPSAPAVPAASMPVVAEPAELRSIVEIAPGKGIEDLIVGERLAPPEPAAEQNLAGLKFVETQALHSAIEPEPAPEPEFIEVIEEFEEEVEISDDAADVTAFQATPSDDIDEEIREVFVEEVQEEIDSLNRNYPQWKQSLADFERLKPIRRSFHTLKGSGRLVGAMALGEFSWKVENMLNRVLDKTIQPGPAVQALLEQAIATLPELLAALRGEGAPKSDTHGMMAVADKIAAGEDAWLAPRVRRTEKVKRQIKRLVPVPPKAPVAETVRIHPTPVELTETLDITGKTLVEQRVFEPLESAQAAQEIAVAEIALPPQIPVIDPVLFDILRSEVAAHLVVIRDYLAQAEAMPLPATEPLLRAVHTLNGAIAMVDIPTIGDVVAPLEGYIKRLRGRNVPTESAGLAAMSDTADLVEDVMIQLESPLPVLPDSSELAARVTALRDALPEPESAYSLYNLAVDEEEVGSVEPVVGTTSPEEDAMWRDAAAVVSAMPTMPAEQEWSQASSSAAEGEDLTANLLRDMEVQESAERAARAAADSAAAQVAAQVAAQLAAEAASREKAAAEQAEVEIQLAAMAAADAAAEAAAHAQATEEALLAPEEITLAFDADSAIDFAEIEMPERGEPLGEALDESILALTEAESLAATSAEALEQVPQAAPVAEAAPAAVEAAPVTATTEATPTAVAAPILDDPQPDGALILPDTDEDLLEIFVQEGADILDHSDGLMVKLRETPQERELITGLQRDLHTLKGGARMAGLAPIGDLGHTMESLLEAIADGKMPMNRVIVESLERGLDRLHSLVQRVGKRQAIAMPDHAIARFEALARGEMPEIIAPPPAAPAAAEVAAAEPAAAVPGAPVEAVKTPPRPAVRPAPIMEEEEIAPRHQEMIRVRSDLLDALVNYAGEVSIYRSRLEQQISTFRFNLVELEQTVLRLRDQLRKLEIETEAQIIARFQREAEEAEHGFDPLELDRFSQLQQLSRALGESVSDLVSIQNLLDDLTRQSETLLLQQSRVSSDLQEGLMRTRMVPFESQVPNLRRLLRQTASELGKRAQLKIEGAQGEMDRTVLDRMKAPLEHMLRNALAHGLESPQDRRSAGKPEDGEIRIGVSREATEVVIRVTDDGKGMDRDAIRRKAIERGLLRADVQLSDRDLFGFVLESGFSTAETVSKIAGRGVGMDVVANEIKQLGGTLTIDSQRGKGTQFTIRLPFTLAVTQAILIKLADHVYAVPMSSVQGVVRIARDDLERRMLQAEPIYAYSGEEYHIHELAALLSLPARALADETQLPLLMTRSGDTRAAIRVDGVIGSREVVVKSVGPQVSSVPGIFGATIMGDGSVVMILDLAPLVRRSAALFAATAELSGEAAMPVPRVPLPVAEVRRQPLVMVVDDSITMRKVTTRVLERNDMEVLTAKDGLDAVEKLQERVPDLMLLDIEMPRMDGYELATYMKNDTRLKLVPIIMITSRTGEKHRQRAMEIGVERYLGKPYQEADLLRNVQEILRLTRAET